MPYMKQQSTCLHDALPISEVRSQKWISDLCLLSSVFCPLSSSTNSLLGLQCVHRLVLFRLELLRGFSARGRVDDPDEVVIRLNYTLLLIPFVLLCVKLHDD